MMKEMKLDKNTMVVLLVVISSIFILGSMCGFGLGSRMTNPEPQQFTAEQAELILEMQAKEDAAESGQLVYGKFDRDGKFWICMDSENQYLDRSAVQAAFRD